MDKDSLMRIKEAAQKATPGPWHIYNDPKSNMVEGKNCEWVLGLDEESLKCPFIKAFQTNEPDDKSVDVATDLIGRICPAKVGIQYNNLAYLAAASPDVVLTLLSEVERLNFIAWHLARIAAMYDCKSEDEAELDKTMCKLFKVAELSVAKGASWKQRNTSSKP